MPHNQRHARTNERIGLVSGADLRVLELHLSNL
jgi:hypothetical protein